MNIVYSITFIRAKVENNSSASSSIIGNHTREYNTTAKVYYSYIFYDVKGKKQSQKKICVYIYVYVCVCIYGVIPFWGSVIPFLSGWQISKTKQKSHQINFYRELLTQNQDGNYFQRGKTGIKSKRCLHGISSNTDNVLFIQLDTMHTHVFLH